jgi:hypothetical protein
MNQFYPRAFGKLRVQAKYLDSEFNFVGHALAARLPCGPKLQIGWLIIVAVAIFVVNVFISPQLAAQNTRHDHAVFVKLLPTALVDSAVSGRNQVSVWRNGTPSAALPPTFFAAKFLPVVVAGWFPVFKTEHAADTDFLAVTALEQWGCDLGHEGQCITSVLDVKEIG